MYIEIRREPFFKYLCSSERSILIGHWTKTNGSVKAVINVLIAENGSNYDIIRRSEMLLGKDDIT